MGSHLFAFQFDPVKYVLMATWTFGGDSFGDYVFEDVDAYVFAAEWADAVPVSFLRVQRSFGLFAPEF